MSPKAPAAKCCIDDEAGQTEESGQADEAESRSGGASQAAELALVPVGGKDPKEGEVGDVSSSKENSTQNVGWR